MEFAGISYLNYASRIGLAYYLVPSGFKLLPLLLVPVT
jgi:hypothetical protein